MSRATPLRIDRCPQCGFKFRGRPEDHEHLSPLGLRLQLAGYWAFLPVMLAVAAFIALTRDERGLMLEFTGRANLIAFAIFSPSVALFVSPSPGILDLLHPIFRRQGKDSHGSS